MFMRIVELAAKYDLALYTRLAGNPASRETSVSG